MSSVYSRAPAPRTPTEGVESLIAPKKDTSAPLKRGAPTNKRLFATFDGKEEALLRTFPQVGKQEGEHIVA